MPLKKGKSHIGENIKTEMEHGKPYKVARAIALNVANAPRKHQNKKDHK